MYGSMAHHHILIGIRENLAAEAKIVFIFGREMLEVNGMICHVPVV